ncbi:interleukin-11 receptor subunit alpha [Diretmus argenteus]
MPGLLSSPVCLTVIWFLSWSLCPGRAQIQTNEVSGVQYGRLESNVTLACGTSPPRTPVEWRLNHSSTLPWHRVTPDGSLVLLHASQSAQGNYSCYDNRGLLLHAIKLMLGHPPGLQSISCRVPNHMRVRCSWVESVKTFLPTQYHASYRGIGQDWKPCVVDAAQRHCDITHPAFWQTSHSVNITETNPLGSTTTIVWIRLNELLKPDPPESVEVEQELGYPTRLLVCWDYPSSWPKHSAFPLMFEIRYRPQGSAHWSQVRAKDEVNSDSQSSDWSPLLLVQPWADPTDEEEGNLGLVILLVLFAVVVLTTILSLILVMWVKQRKRDHVTKQELSSMVKMKSMPI